MWCTDCLCRLSQVRRVLFPSEQTRKSYLSKNMLTCLLLKDNIGKIPNLDKNEIAENLELQDLMHKIFE